LTHFGSSWVSLRQLPVGSAPAVGKKKMKGLQMAPAPKWQYNEMKFSGVDYSQVDEVEAYDRMHKKFRDYARSSEEIIRRLSLSSDSTVIDFGSGTGAFTLYAAKRCRTVYALHFMRPRGAAPCMLLIYPPP
jgi:hypothetical protein